MDVGCPRCGHRSPIGSNFCSSCGFSLVERRDDTTAVQTIIDLDSGSTGEFQAPDQSPIVPVSARLGVLVVTRGPNVGARIPLSSPLTTLGRHPESHIFLDDITVSRRHAEIEADGNTFNIRDVASLNGTYVNRERVDEVVLEPGDEVQIGKFRLVFVARQDD